MGNRRKDIFCLNTRGNAFGSYKDHCVSTGWIKASTCNLSWKVPETVEKIANDKEDKIYTRFDHEERLLGFQFLADMINRWGPFSVYENFEIRQMGPRQ